jgi:hypothetical protein
MKHNKGAGEDGLVSTYVKCSIKGFMKPLVNLFKRSQEERVIPDEWKRANVTAIFKKGAKWDPANYRPVSPTSQIGTRSLSISLEKEFCLLCNINSSLQY